MWKDKVVWITGASSGIGAALARSVSALGATVVATARNPEALAQVSSQCRGPVHVVPADLTNIEGIAGLVASVRDLVGGIDVLILNAGVSQRAAALETTPEVTDRILAIDLRAPIEIARVTVPSMIAAGGGTVVVVTSLAGKAGFPLRSTYCAAKHGLHGYFEALRAETAEHKIQVTIAVPGFVRTEISRNAVAADGSQWGRLDQNQATGISADTCAKDIVRGIDRGRLEVYTGLGFRGRLALLLHSAAPRLFARSVRKAKTT